MAINVGKLVVKNKVVVTSKDATTVPVSTETITSSKPTLKKTSSYLEAMKRINTKVD